MKNLELRWLVIISCLFTGAVLAEENQPSVNNKVDTDLPLQTQSTAEEKQPSDSAKEKQVHEVNAQEKVVVTQHEMKIGESQISYTVKAGKMPVKMNGGKVKAEIFYMAYTKDGVEDLGTRPVTFSFNGGPGASSVWMHLGLLGPRRVKLKDDGTAYPPPYQLEDNPHSLLDETDLVFIDPVSTGYSRANNPDEANKFHGVKEDTASVGEFIRLYVTKNERWGSPKFLIGESYGTTRAAALSGELFSRHHMNLNGIMLVSTVLDFQTIAASGGRGNDLGHVLFLPSYTTVAWHHHKLPEDLQKMSLKQVTEAAERFAVEEYQLALFAGSSLTGEARHQMLQKMSRFTGLAPDYLDRVDLRPSMSRFSVELLREEGKQAGRFDGRFAGYLQNREAEWYERDESADAVFPVFASAFNQYVRKELKVEDDEPYEVLARLGPWNWNANNEYLNVASVLAKTMMSNPHLKVHVSAGYADLATPYFAAKYTINHLPIPAELRQNIVIDYYDSGHMMFLNKPDLVKQKQDLARFIRWAINGKE